MSEKNKHWLLRKDTIRILWMLFIAVLIGTVIAGFFVHQHESFGIEDSVGFFAWYGFITCVGMVFFAKLLGFFLKRPENYYDANLDNNSNTDQNKKEIHHD